MESILRSLDESLLTGDDAASVIAQLLPFPDPAANKYTRGRLTLVAGSARYPGAAVLAAQASQRMGAGYTQVVCAPAAIGAVRAASPSLVMVPWDEWRVEELPKATSEKPAAVCIGPGFDAADTAALDLAAEVLSAAQCPAIVDGGGLTLLAQPRARRILEARAADGFATVITPHEGEAARIATAWDIESPRSRAEERNDCEVDADAAAQATSDFACDLAEALACTVVLKGPSTFIACDENTLEMDFGGPELAKAGTGDVLAGMVGALLAQGMEPFDASALAVSVHALAGAYAAERLTSICVTAEDVIDFIPHAVAGLADA